MSPISEQNLQVEIQSCKASLHGLVALLIEFTNQLERVEYWLTGNVESTDDLPFF